MAERLKRGTPIHVKLIEYSADGENGCRVWSRSLHPTGYGQVLFNGRMRLAHKVSYEAFVGPVPFGKQLDHLCRNRACIDPAHLEPVTQQENIQRGEAGQRSGRQQVAKTHCPQGHPYSGENLCIRNTGKRQCRQCARDYYHRRRSNEYERTSSDTRGRA